MLNLTIVIFFVAVMNVTPSSSKSIVNDQLPTNEIQRGGGFIPPTKKTDD
ncbi:hypothetical protein AN214_04037 [Pseudoalteromonas sp. P1-9]|nr:hypothetical protein AN214_04037 [Pseudoalteromonas sp. P1-9]